MRRAILKAHPELADERFSVAGRGFDSLAVDVGGRLVFKFPEAEAGKAALRREAAFLSAIGSRLTLPVPRMSIHEGPPLFSEHGKLIGGTLLRDDYLRLDETSRSRLADDLALFFAELHTLDVDVMKDAGAEPVEIWDTRDETLAPIWDVLPADCAEEGREALCAYRAMGPDPLGDRYGFFDAHGWNMAFDMDAGRLNGIFDFADSGLGPIHREFCPVSLVHPDLTARSMRAYEARTGRVLEYRRIYLLTAAMLMAELAGAIESGGDLDFHLGFVVGWLTQQSVR